MKTRLKVKGREISKVQVDSVLDYIKRSGSVRSADVENILRDSGYDFPMRGADRILQSFKRRCLISFRQDTRRWHLCNLKPVQETDSE